MKRVAIIGISGFPSRKGGFDSFVSELVENSRGQIFFELYTETSNQSDKAESGVNFIKIPVFRPIGFFGLIQHRIEAFRRAEYGKCENIYILGYTALPFVFRKNKRKNLMVNMDGLEWKRSEYSLIKRTFLRLAEYIAVTKADILVADSLSIQAYIFEKFKRRSVFVPYSAPLPCEFSRDQVQSVLSKFKLTIADYYLFVGRCVRENHLLEIHCPQVRSRRRLIHRLGIRLVGVPHRLMHSLNSHQL